MLHPYRISRAVMAAKIVKIQRGQTSRLHLGDEQFVDVELDWMNQYKPQLGGYYILDDHAYYLSREVFELAFARMDG